MPEIIDWSLPLETDEPTPRKATLVRVEPPTIVAGGVYVVRTPVDVYTYFSGGKPMRPAYPKIRNVRALRTSDECLQRMEALVRRMAVRHETRPPGHVDPNDAEAAQIVKLLPVPPVDPDVINARKLVADAYHQDGSSSYEAVMNGGRDSDEAFQMALAGLQRGRELAKTPDMVELVAKLIEQSEPGGAHTYRCDQNVREIAGRVASAWNGSVAQ